MIKAAAALSGSAGWRIVLEVRQRAKPCKFIAYMCHSQDFDNQHGSTATATIKQTAMSSWSFSQSQSYWQPQQRSERCRGELLLWYRLEDEQFNWGCALWLQRAANQLSFALCISVNSEMTLKKPHCVFVQIFKAFESIAYRSVLARMVFQTREL